MIYKNFIGIKKVDGKVIPLYDDIHYNVLLTEENSGFTDHKAHAELSDNIYNGWLNILNRISNKNIQLNQCDDVDEFNYTEIVNFDALEDYGFPDKTLKKYTLECYVLIDSGRNHPIVGGELNFDKNKREESVITLRINLNYSVTQILQHKELIKEISSHETTHFIKHVYGTYQKSLTDFKHPERSERNRLYLKYKHEFDANISQSIQN